MSQGLIAGCCCVCQRGGSWGQYISWAGPLAPSLLLLPVPSTGFPFSSHFSHGGPQSSTPDSLPLPLPLLFLACFLLANHLCIQPFIQENLKCQAPYQAQEPQGEGFPLVRTLEWGGDMQTSECPQAGPGLGFLPGHLTSV